MRKLVLIIMLLSVIAAPLYGPVCAPSYAEDGLIANISNSPHAEGLIQKNIKMFSQTFREHFSRWMARYGRYNDLIRRILTDKNIPEEFVFLAMIESGFSTHAYSRAKAVGPWQFISGTAKRYGLKVDWWVDERRDPVKSTEAAAAYLGDLHNIFGSWGLAMAAYNAGEGAIKKALRKVKGDDFWDLQASRRIKTETKNYVPKFVAASIIVNSPEDYGFAAPVFEDNFVYDEVVLWEPLDLYVAARCAGTTFEKMKELNPELTRWCTPPNVKTYILKIPKGTLVAFLEELKTLGPDEKFPLKTYKTKKGDTLTRVARKFNLPPVVIAELNGMKYNKKINKRKLPQGQELYIPLEGRYRDHYLMAQN